MSSYYLIIGDAVFATEAAAFLIDNPRLWGKGVGVRKFSFFHHPDISLTVLRRRAGEAVVDALECYAELAVTVGRSFVAGPKPSQTAHRSAICRLHKAGVLAYRKSRNGEPVLQIVKPAHQHEFRPHMKWNEKWRGIWSIMLYDVPERQRPFRDSLRSFLRRLRMGCLQKSVWISPRDIRPEYDDLVQAIGVDSLSYLLEARTVLGRKSMDLVHEAWNFGDLARRQNWYLRNCRRVLKQLRSGKFDQASINTIAHEEIAAYLDVMTRDPLLPRSLHPPGYRGFEVYETHREFIATVAAMSSSIHPKL